ncbi:MAG: lipid-A-disaccharide synthase [Dysgonamonadaceae bacterium]|jgi:lipid-A-disaccharide synthase|nr:lipid-A-disaccharide synthase [Dysgonamonadaceae bacterium]
MKYYLIAGEASGDLHASNLMRSLKKRDEEADFRFFGGDLMLEQGGVLVKHYREMAFMGVIPVLMNLNAILKAMALCKRDIARYRPDVVILVDYPGFNLKIAKYVKPCLKIPVFYYISPKVWAWKEYRVKSFKKYVDEMLCILPFEVDFFKKHRYKVDYVGNPTVDAIANRPFQDETFNDFILANRLPDKPVIALLAGSRRREISQNLPSMLKAAKEFSDYQLIIAGAPGIAPDFYTPFVEGRGVRVIFNQTYRILAQSSAAMVTSGTATLETALLSVPQVVCYKTDFPKLSYWGFKHILHTPYISLVNLICGKEVVKELFARLFSPDAIRDELQNLLSDKAYRENMLKNYRVMQDVLGKSGASDRAAEIVVGKLMKRGG